MFTTTRPSDVVGVLPSEAARDLAYYRSRIGDPALLAAAVTVRIADELLLAVPVGGGRRGGYLSYGGQVIGEHGEAAVPLWAAVGGRVVPYDPEHV
ncbi:DUF6302 family protein, partial [Streptomyces sp. NPDC020875]|uniref:DUF6302 family protein n=1 Tax=Streptomyces sp. NPDC020875 TaxID=3154898 RepID=UPI0033C59157